jgi:predicted membrane protein
MHLSILQVVFYYFLLRTCCGKEYSKTFGLSEDENFVADTISKSVLFSILSIVVILIPVVFISHLLVMMVQTVKQRRKRKADEKKKKDMLRKREGRKKKSLEKIGYQRKRGGQAYLCDNEEDYILNLLKLDIDLNIFHPLSWIAHKVFFCLFFF